MRVVYDRETDTLTITLRKEPIRESDEIRPRMIADLGYDGRIVRLEILRASQAVERTTAMELAVGVWPLSWPFGPLSPDLVVGWLLHDNDVVRVRLDQAGAGDTHELSGLQQVGNARRPHIAHARAHATEQLEHVIG